MGKEELRGICPWSLLGEKIKHEKNDRKISYEAWDRNATREDKKILHQSKAHIQQMKDGLNGLKLRECLVGMRLGKAGRGEKEAGCWRHTHSLLGQTSFGKHKREGLQKKEQKRMENTDAHYRSFTTDVEKSYWFIALRPVVSTLF